MLDWLRSKLKEFRCTESNDNHEEPTYIHYDVDFANDPLYNFPDASAKSFCVERLDCNVNWSERDQTEPVKKTCSSPKDFLPIQNVHSSALNRPEEVTYARSCSELQISPRIFVSSNQNP
ncbi:hypothetical protein AVEN_141400-1 [Araneus ventricosus]|uniref:Uncharacterized protein n=1 Tax=Araneus ventricosus TaxID=182803 RepID=A0A4Y2CYD2_ARAVE|nr:hypothetical protein AVEN_141400-1 [Araneus ventricosus]